MFSQVLLLKTTAAIIASSTDAKWLEIPMELLPVFLHAVEISGEVTTIIAGQTGRAVNEKVFAEVELADGSVATVGVRALGALEIVRHAGLVRLREMRSNGIPLAEGEVTAVADMAEGAIPGAYLRHVSSQFRVSAV